MRDISWEISLILEVVLVGDVSMVARDKEYVFTRLEVMALANLTDSQLRQLKEKEILIPQLSPIRYSWNQLIEAAIFSCLRQHFSWKKAVDYLFKYRKIHDYDSTTYYHADLIVVQPGRGMVFKSSIDPFTLKKDLVMEVKFNQSVEALLSLKKQEDGSFVREEVIQDQSIYIYVSNLIQLLWDIAEAKKLKLFPKKACLQRLHKSGFSNFESA